MSYTVHQLANLAKTSVRTLHYYDQIGLLKPGFIAQNGYRYYDEPELLRLQQILFFKELEFELSEIKNILDTPGFDIRVALLEQKKLLTLKQKRLEGLTFTIEKTIKKLNEKTNMQDEELYAGFDETEMKNYAAEAKQRWGHTEAYRQSTERVGKMSKDDITKIKETNNILLKKISEKIKFGAESEEVQKLIKEHYENLRFFYEPNLELYAGLAEMYVSDERFAKYFNQFHPELAQFMHDAMKIFCNKNIPN
jgi:DNA-binding transcriptional MerR regulator